jgi:hypothetical protein
MLDQRLAGLLDQLGVDPAVVEAVLSSLTFLTVLVLVTAIPTWMIAKRKGRSTAFWLVFALTIPVLPLLLIWLLPAVPSAGKQD